MHEKETNSSFNEEKYASLVAEMNAVKDEKEKWRSKAEKTLTVQMLESELENLKVQFKFIFYFLTHVINGNLHIAELH